MEPSVSSVASDLLSASDFEFDLPQHLIAQVPLAKRDASRLLVLDRTSGSIAHSSICRLPDWLHRGDLLVANNSRVIPARMHGVRLPGGGAVELLLLREQDGIWKALARPANRLKPGSKLRIPARDGSTNSAEVLVNDNLGEGEVLVSFRGDSRDPLSLYGETPLPPYITEPLVDPGRYQTVYARVPGSAAAPTAGLHFTPELLAELHAAGIGWAEVTLHVGLDTFRPVTADRVSAHRIHREWYEATRQTVEAVAECRARGGKVVAVGTTAARTLETIAQHRSGLPVEGASGFSDLFIVPGYRWRLVDAMLTNFHLPRSTLLMMVSALAGREAILSAYQEAVVQEYRFYSFGDAMLIL